MIGPTPVWTWDWGVLVGLTDAAVVLAFSWEDILGFIFFLLVILLQKRGKPEAEPSTTSTPEPTPEPKPVVTPRTVPLPPPVVVSPAPTPVTVSNVAELDQFRIELLATTKRLRMQVRNLEMATKTSARWQVIHEYIAESLRPRIELFGQQLDNRQETVESASYIAISQALLMLKTELGAVSAWKTERDDEAQFAVIGVAEVLIAEWTGLLQQTASTGGTWPVRYVAATRLPPQTVHILEGYASKIGLFFVPLSALRVEKPLEVPLIARSVFHMLMQWHPQFANELRAAWNRSTTEGVRSEFAEFIPLLVDMWSPILVADMLAVWVTGPTIVDRVIAPARPGAGTAAYAASATFDGTRWSSVPPPIGLVLCGCAVLRRNGLADMATRLLDAWQEKVGRSDTVVVTLTGDQSISVPLALISEELSTRIERSTSTKLATLAGYSLANIPSLAYSQIHRDDRERVVLWLRQGLPGNYSPRAIADGALSLALQENGDISVISKAFLKAILGKDGIFDNKKDKNIVKREPGVITSTEWRRAVVDQELFARHQFVRQTRNQRTRFTSSRAG